MNKLLAAFFILCVVNQGGLLVTEAGAAEKLEYTVLHSGAGNIELRQYKAFIVAEIDVSADNVRQAGRVGFRPLANYIFGGNVPNKKIAMTAPVTTKVKDGQKIAMTAPVTTIESDTGQYTVQFSMPSKWTLDTLPKPENDLIRLVQMPEHLRLAKKYRGEASIVDLAEGEQSLIAYTRENDLTIVGSAIWAGYSAPFIPKSLRKWELMFTVVRP